MYVCIASLRSAGRHALQNQRYIKYILQRPPQHLNLKRQVILNSVIFCLQPPTLPRVYQGHLDYGTLSLSITKPEFLPPHRIPPSISLQSSSSIAPPCCRRPASGVAGTTAANVLRSLKKRSNKVYTTFPNISHDAILKIINQEESKASRKANAISLQICGYKHETNT